MIKFKELNKSKPYEIFKEKYDEAEFHNQKNIEAVLISSSVRNLMKLMLGM